MQLKNVTASIHSADLAHVLALVPTADSAAPGHVPGHLGVVGTAALPHPSFARRERIGKRLTYSCL
jgi:hypothetical protein